MTRSPASFGSPIMPVAPPTRNTSLWQASPRRFMRRTGTRWPTWSESAVGSTPRYTVLGKERIFSVAVDECSTSPRAFSSSDKVMGGTIPLYGERGRTTLPREEEETYGWRREPPEEIRFRRE